MPSLLGQFGSKVRSDWLNAREDQRCSSRVSQVAPRRRFIDHNPACKTTCSGLKLRMAKRHRDILETLDPIAVNRYNITEADIEMVEKYLGVIQEGYPGGSTWQDVIQYPGAYAASVIIHEIVEIRVLEAKGLKPLRQRKATLLRRMLAQNEEAHVTALYEEHIYLKEVISRSYNQTFEVATLIRANRGDDADLERLLESDIGAFFLEESRIEEAEQVIARLKGEKI